MFHGTLADSGLGPGLKIILQLCRDGVVAKLASNKKGLPETIRALAGVDVYKFMVPTRVPAPPAEATIRAGRVGPHIGVLGNDIFRKNIHNQVAAALLIEGSIVHVAGHLGLDYWGCDHRLVYHPANVAHRDYLAALGQMDVNLHLSFTESWGQVTTESLALGVPCIIASHGDVYDDDPLLRERLASAHVDNPHRLADDVAGVLADRQALGARGARYVEVLNRKAEDLLHRFLTA